jgi:hypothetical protein
MHFVQFRVLNEPEQYEVVKLGFIGDWLLGARVRHGGRLNQARDNYSSIAPRTPSQPPASIGGSFALLSAIRTGKTDHNRTLVNLPVLHEPENDRT